MRTKLVGIGLAILFVIGSVSVVLADRPTPGTKPQEHAQGTPTPKLQSNPEKGAKRHGIFGTITFKGASTFTLTTKQGETVTVTVTAQTRFHIPTKRHATFADLMVGERVAVNGTPTATGLTAKQVAVAPGKPTVQHRVGTVTAYTAGSSITIKTVQGTSETFTLTSQTKIRNPKGTGVAVGDRVTVVARRDPDTTTFTATAIVVHPED